ncbi:MAG: PrsW family intramembrane metalloprotease [Planctomycetaceae bacterium]|jgi:RsiW-degrading membrane proteinase PrsW (M82 family)|nr:PrsW family intramembrane metalloprotease [Planctomycetaceae bacterium]
MTNQWYYYDFSGNKKGPIDLETLRRLAASGKIFSNTQIVTPEGQTKQASKIAGLQFGTSTSPNQQTSSTPYSEQQNYDPMGTVQEIFDTFRKTDFKKEIIPIDADNAVGLFKDPIFWVVLVLGVLPLLITSMNDINIQLYGLLFFFAMLWGGILRGLVLKSSDNVVLPVTAFFATGIVGVGVLLFLYKHCLPSFYLHMTDPNNNPLIQLFGFIFQVGFCEELCKVMPVVLYLILKRKKASPMMMLLIGVFSGLGFAAFENVSYVFRHMTAGAENIVQIIENILRAQSEEQMVRELKAGSLNAAGQILNAMLSMMLRSVSLVFAHAIWTGIFSYYIICAMTSGKRWAVFCCLGLAVPMVLHGVYDWLCNLEPGFAALVIGASFVLFYGYLSKIRQQLKIS